MTASLTTLGSYHSATFHLLALPSLTSSWPPLPSASYFRLVIFLDVDNIGTDEDRRTLITNALSCGARSVLCGGSYCSRLHDEFDLVLVEDETNGVVAYCDSRAGQFVVTTWHDDEPVDEILWQAACLDSHGHDDFESDTPQIMIALLANDERIDEIRRIAASLPHSLDCVVDREEAAE